MTILFLSPFPSKPLYGGAVVRNHHLARALSIRYKVVASFCHPDGDPRWLSEVPLNGAGWRALFNPLFIFRAWREIRKQQVQAIVSSSLIAGLHGVILKLLTGLPFWMDEHNVEWHCSKRYGLRSWPLVYLLEGLVLKMADSVTCVSAGDRERLIKHFRLSPQRVTVAPNGVDLAALKAPTKEALPKERTRRRVLFFGVLSYPPNRDAVLALSNEIAPDAPDDIDFLIAGTGEGDLPELCPNLEFQGFVDDIHALIRECDGVIVPLKSGGGTRMKILESIACGRPVLSTTLGAEGLDHDILGAGLTVTDDPEQTQAWLQDLSFGHSLETSDLFDQTYDWESIWARSIPL